MENSRIQFIYLITPTTNEERLPKVIQHANGFIYYVSVTGITGTKTASSEHVELALSRIRGYTDLPIAVGFGIKTPEQATKIVKYADAAVVGSALVSRVEENLDANGKPTSACVTSVLELVGQISEGIRSVSKNAQENATE
jgi:tryptophan synthase alpha chain